MLNATYNLFPSTRDTAAIYYYNIINAMWNDGYKHDALNRYNHYVHKYHKNPLEAKTITTVAADDEFQKNSIWKLLSGNFLLLL